MSGKRRRRSRNRCSPCNPGRPNTARNFRRSPGPFRFRSEGRPSKWLRCRSGRRKRRSSNRGPKDIACRAHTARKTARRNRRRSRLVRGGDRRTSSIDTCPRRTIDPRNRCKKRSSPRVHTADSRRRHNRRPSLSGSYLVDEALSATRLQYTPMRRCPVCTWRRSCNGTPCTATIDVRLVPVRIWFMQRSGTVGTSVDVQLVAAPAVARRTITAG
jgi:hypothetical protein